jgi:hypothetical protein
MVGTNFAPYFAARLGAEIKLTTTGVAGFAEIPLTGIE